MKKLKAVVFDMDGVLFDTERLCKESWNIIAGKQHLEKIDEVLEKCIGVNKQSTIRIMKEAYGEDFPVLEFMEACSRMEREKIKEEGIPIKQGAKEILAFLKEERCRIGLASSTRKSRILENLEMSGLKDYFQVIVGGDMVKHGKPDPEIYLCACKELSVLPKEAYAVEDSFNGIRSAYRAGMMPVMVPDLIAPTEEILNLTVTCKKNLMEVIDYFRSEIMIERGK